MDISAVSSNNDSLIELLKQQEKTQTQAPKKKHQKPTVDQMVSQLTSKLGLNDNQMIELKKIIQNSMKNMDEEMKNNQAAGTDRQAGTSKMKDIMDKMNEQIKSILTPDQATAFEKLLEERKSQQMGNGNFDKTI